MKMTYLLPLLAALGLTACTAGNNGTAADSDSAATTEQNESAVPADMLDGEWRIVKYTPADGTADGLADAGGEEPYLFKFDSREGSFYCNTDCNNISGAYFRADDTLTFSNMFSTRMACERMDLERGLQALLPQVRKYEIKDNHAALKDDNGNVLLTLKRSGGDESF